MLSISQSLVFIEARQGAMCGGVGGERGNKSGGGGETVIVQTGIVVIRLEPANAGSVVRMARTLQTSELQTTTAGAGAV